MSTKQEHLQLIKDKGRFTVNCSHAIFSNEEIELLEKWGHWFTALTDGTLEPLTEMQQAFVRVARREQDPVSPEELAWNKYLHRREMEGDPSNRLHLRYEYEQDTFFNRDMVKKQRSTMFRVMKEKF